MKQWPLSSGYIQVWTDMRLRPTEAVDKYIDLSSHVTSYSRVSDVFKGSRFPGKPGNPKSVQTRELSMKNQEK